MKRFEEDKAGEKGKEMFIQSLPIHLVFNGYKKISKILNRRPTNTRLVFFKLHCNYSAWSDN
jgi:hypothetical protein